MWPKSLSPSSDTSRIPSLRRVWGTSFALIVLMGMTWALATPLFGVPDEPSHITRAASVVRGELLGREPSVGEIVGASPYLAGITRYVSVPGLFDDAGKFRADRFPYVPCYAFEPDQHAGCRSYGPNTGTTAEIPTSAGEHPPIWYVLVGIPSLISVESFGIYGMRLINVVLSAALIATAMTSLWWDRADGALVGLLVALTPMVFFLTGGVNSSGPEIAAGLAVWATLIVLVRSPDSPSWLIAAAGISAVALVLSRKPGMIWLLLIAGVVTLAVGSRKRVISLARQRVAHIWGAVILVSVAFQILWMKGVGAIDVATASPAGVSVLSTLHGSAANLYWKQVRQVFGVFGWLDTPAPETAYALWLLAVGALLALAIISHKRRLLTAAGMVVLTSASVMMLWELAEAGNRYLFWQGRYSMPVSLGILLLLGYALSPTIRQMEGWHWSKGMFVVLITSAHTIAFWHYLRRVTVGARGDIRFLWQPEWRPPVQPGLLLIAYIAGILMLSIWLTQAPRSSRHVHSRF